MGLRQHGPRELSNLEKAAIDLVFGDISISPEDRTGLLDELEVHIVKADVDINRDHRRGSYVNNTITIAIDQHPCADDLDDKSALGNVEILKPGNMDYLNTFIHEATHHWQSVNARYEWHGDVRPVSSSFTEKELTESPPLRPKWENQTDDIKELSKRNLLNLLKEQHASAAGTWFVIGWQLKYASNYVDLTTKRGASVGTVDRYEKIKKIKHAGDRRWVTRDTAIMLASAFDIVLAELRTGYYWGHIN